MDLQEIHHQQGMVDLVVLLDLITLQTLVDLERTVKDIKVEIMLLDIQVLVVEVLVKQVKMHLALILLLVQVVMD